MGQRKEPQILGLLAMSLAFKYVKSSTLDEFVGVGIMFGKFANLVMFQLIDSRFTIYYSILCLVLWLILKQPKYSGPNKMIKVTSSDHFYEILECDPSDLVIGHQAEKRHEQIQKQKKKQIKAGDITSKDKNFAQIKSTVLLFTADWAEPCIYSYSLWVRFANRFSTEKV